MTIKHEEIARELRSAIKAGDYPPGSTIPALPELMQRYGVARNTVRDAVSSLTHEGLVTPMQGVGTVVRDTTPIVLTLRPEETSPTWQEGYDELVQAVWNNPDPEVTNLFGSPDYLYRLRHQWRGEQIAQVHEQWIPRDVVESIRAIGVTLDDPRNPPEINVFTAMTRADMPPDMLSETVSARTPDPEEARVMAIPPGVPVISVLRITRSTSGRPLETSLYTGSADRISHGYQVPYQKSPHRDRHAV